MFEKMTKWGACAALVLGAMGATHHVAAQSEEIDPRATELVKACDANKDGAVSWQEVLDRDRERAKALRNARKRVDRDKVRTKYALTFTREQFLLADSDDDLVLGAAEVQAMLDAPAKEVDYDKAPPLSGKALEALAAANVEDQWTPLVAQIDKDKNKKLSKKEIEIHFLFYGDDPDAEDGMGSFAVDPAINIAKSFTAADKDGDKQLVKAEYPEFVALEFRRNNLDYIEYFVNEEVADNPLGVVVGSTYFVRSKGGSDWNYELYTMTRVTSKLSRGAASVYFEAKTTYTDANKKVKGASNGLRTFGWEAARIENLPVEEVKVGSKTFECYVEESTAKRPKRADGRKTREMVDVTVKTWRLKEFYGIEARREEGGEVITELLEVKAGE